MDDPKGHLKKMLSASVLNGFRKNGIPDHELLLKVDDICLVTCAITTSQVTVGTELPNYFLTTTILVGA